MPASYYNIRFPLKVKLNIHMATVLNKNENENETKILSTKLILKTFLHNTHEYLEQKQINSKSKNNINERKKKKTTEKKRRETNSISTYS